MKSSLRPRCSDLPPLAELCRRRPRAGCPRRSRSLPSAHPPLSRMRSSRWIITAARLGNCEEKLVFEFQVPSVDRRYTWCGCSDRNPKCRSMRCFPKLAAYAELPRAQVTTTRGGHSLSNAQSWLMGRPKHFRLAGYDVGRLPSSVAISSSTLLTRTPGFGEKSSHELPFLRASVRANPAYAISPYFVVDLLSSRFLAGLEYL